MGREDLEDKAAHRVLINDEDQYSVWPANKDVPIGWRDTGFSGSKAECLEHVKEVWTDMTPRSLRKSEGSVSGV